MANKAKLAAVEHGNDVDNQISAEIQKLAHAANEASAEQQQPTTTEAQSTGTQFTEQKKPTPSPTDIFNDLDALRVQSKLQVRQRSILTNISVVKKPPNDKHFRVHPEEAMTLVATVIFDDADNCYFITPGMRTQPKLIKRLRYVLMRLAVLWPEQQPVIWPVPLVRAGVTDVAAWKSYRMAAEHAETHWTQMVWDPERRDFDVTIAENIPHEPQWPKDSLSDQLKIAFEGRIIDNDNHEYLQILRGIVD
jgi:hypothetical protein